MGKQKGLPTRHGEGFCLMNLAQAALVALLVAGLSGMAFWKTLTH